MRKLLRAGFVRTRMMKGFWLGMVVLAGYGLFATAMNYRSAVKYGMDLGVIFTDCMFQPIMILGLTAAIYGTMFVGAEYNDGVVRNKLVVGQSRTSIYLSNYINCAAVGVLHIATAYFISWAVGFVLMGKPEIGTRNLLEACAITLLLCLSYAAVYNFCSMMINSRAHAAIVNLLLFIGMLFVASYLFQMLMQPPTYEQYSVNEANMATEIVENPRYVSGLKRDIYQFLIDFLPGGQVMQLVAGSGAVQHPSLQCLYSGMIVIVFNLAGIFFFQRKDIK